MKPLRVLLISNGFAIEYPLGGIERFVVSLARSLDRTRIEPVVCGLWDWGTEFDGRWLSVLRAEGIEAFAAAPKDDTNPLRNYREMLAGMRAHLSQPVDLIHSHSEFGDPAAIWLKRELGARALLRTVHNEREWPKRRLRRILFTNLLLPWRFDGEFGVSQRVVDNLNARPVARVLGKRSRVLHNAVDFSRFPPDPDRAVARSRVLEELGLPADALLLGSVGRLAPQKGYDLLLAAMPSVLARHPNARLLLIGDGAERANLEAQRDVHNLGDSVHLLGARTDVEQLLPALDLFVSSSRWEGLPTVILEAMACGTPVLGTRVSGTVELIEDGGTGKLVAPNDAGALALGINEMLDHPEMLVAVTGAANDFARGHFSMDRVAREHEALYFDQVDGLRATST